MGWYNLVSNGLFGFAISSFPGNPLRLVACSFFFLEILHVSGNSNFLESPLQLGLIHTHLPGFCLRLISLFFLSNLLEFLAILQLLKILHIYKTSITWMTLKTSFAANCTVGAHLSLAVVTSWVLRQWSLANEFWENSFLGSPVWIRHDELLINYINSVY